MDIQRLTADLARDRARQESRRCKCAGMPEDKRPCAACRVRAFCQANGGAHRQGGTWSEDISRPAGTSEVH